eukprot:scaffold96491_cov63-Phaeocystis_antarctica.AAC.4
MLNQHSSTLVVVRPCCRAADSAAAACCTALPTSHGRAPSCSSGRDQRSRAPWKPPTLEAESPPPPPPPPLPAISSAASSDSRASSSAELAPPGCGVKRWIATAPAAHGTQTRSCCQWSGCHRWSGATDGLVDTLSHSTGAVEPLSSSAPLHGTVEAAVIAF